MIVNRNYTRLWLGRTVSLTGDVVFDTTVVLWVAAVLLRGAAYAPIVTGAILAVVSLTLLVVGPVAGVLVDRWPDKRAVLLRTDLLRAGLVGALAVAAGLPRGALPLPVLLGLIGLAVAAGTAMAQFANAARFVLIADVVPEEQRGRATGYGQATAALATMAGPSLAGPLLFGFGPQWAVAANALSFLVSYVAVRGVQVPPRTHQPTPRTGLRREYADGIRAITASRVLTGVVLSRSVAVLGVGAVTALDVYFVADNLHADPRFWFGVLGAVLGAGVLAGAVLGGRLTDRYGSIRVYCPAVLGNGALLVGYSTMDTIGPAVAAVAGLGLTAGIIGSAATPLFLSRVPREYQGRVSSVLTLSYHLPSLVSMLLAGLLAAATRRIDVVFGFAGLLVLAAGCYAVWALRGDTGGDARRPSPAEGQPPPAPDRRAPAGHAR